MSYGAEQPASKLTQESVNSVVLDLDHEIERLTKLVQGLEAISSRIEGARPQDVSTEAPDTPPHSLIDSLRRKQRSISRLIGVCEALSSRIYNAIGN